MKECAICNKQKDVSEFNVRQSKCKVCQSNYAEAYRKSHKEYKRVQRRAWIEANRFKRTAYTVKSFRTYLTNSCKAIKREDEKIGREYNIDIEFLIDLLIQQDYKCAVSGIVMVHGFGNVRSVSIDRIDSTKGHTKDNIQLICQLFNLGKRDRPDADLRSIIREIELNLLRRLRERGKLNIQ